MEREAKLSVPTGFRRPSLDGSAGAVAGPVIARRYTTVYHDSRDLVLAAWACSLRHRSGEGWTVKLPSSLDGSLLARPEHTFRGAADAPPPEALTLLAGFLRGRAVEPVARASTTRRGQILTGANGGPVLEIVDDTVVSLDGTATRRLRQFEVELLDESATGVLEEVLRRMRRAGAVAGDTRTKYEWLLADRLPAPEVVVPHLGRDSSLRDAIRATLGRSVMKLMYGDAAIRAGEDPEGVHEARVAARRLRSDLRAFADVLETDWGERLRSELGWAGDVLGAARDAEVLVARIERSARSLDDLGAARGIVTALRDDVAATREKLAGIASDPRYLALLDTLVLAARSPLFRLPAGGPAADQLAPVVDRAWRRLRKAADAAVTAPTDASLHRVRIRAKQARYAAESVAPLLGKPAVRFARRVTRLQDALGEHQDAVVAWAWLHDAARGAADAFVAGELAGLELAARHHAREHWPEAWKAVRPARPSTWR